MNYRRKLACWTGAIVLAAGMKLSPAAEILKFSTKNYAAVAVDDG